MKDGYLWAVEFDIKDFFSSFDGKKAISLLPIPKRVGERVLLGEHLTLLAGPTLIDGCEGDAEHNLLNDELVKARQGFPQGSAASSFVTEALLADTIHMIAKIGVVVAYVDNILLLTKTKVDAASMFILSSALKAHPAGPFQPSIKHFNAGEPIDFLGHTLTPKNGLIRIDPDDHNRQKLQKLMQRVTSTCAALNKMTLQPLTRQKIAKRLEREVRDRTEWLKLCDGIEEIRSQAQIQINEALNPLEENKPMNNTFPKTFKLHPDQKEIVEAALKLAKQKSGTKFDTVALEYICQQFMGTGYAFSDLKSAMVAERKKSATEEEFIGKVANLIQEILGKAVTLTFKEHLGVVPTMAPGSGIVASHNNSELLDTVSQHDPQPCN
jgi:hypothetical protein